MISVVELCILYLIGDFQLSLMLVLSDANRVDYKLVNGQIKNEVNGFSLEIWTTAALIRLPSNQTTGCNSS